MKKIIFLFLVFSFSFPAFSFFPFYHGARSLSLGYSSLAFNYDLNAIYINPALLNSLAASLGGYQFQSSFLDFQDFNSQVSAMNSLDLKNFKELDGESKAAILAKLKEVFASRMGISGFRINNPGYAGKGFGLAVAKVDAAVMFPLDDAVLYQPMDDISNADIASLQMRIIGFHYTDYALSFAFTLGQGVSLGATAHYLKGQNMELNAAITASPFQGGADARDCLQFAWSGANKDFSKLNFDVGVNADLGPYFKAGLLVKNVGNPVIATDVREIRLARQLMAGLVIRPDAQLGISLDIAVAKGDSFHNGHDVQPLSLGIEKGLFQNKLFLRAGFMSDLAAKYFFGRQANIMYGLGLGFNLGKFLIDLAMGLDPLGHVKNLGISGFYLIK
jgi:hypothetical protein